MDYLIFIILGYVSGSVMYAYLLPKLIRHIDICELSNDGNPGTANAFIHAGIPVGILVIICELLKGALPVLLASHFVDVTGFLFAIVLVAPVWGHAFPLFCKKTMGGKSIAVSFGVLLGLFPTLSPVIALAFFYIFFSLVVTISPHFFRSIVTFLSFCGYCLYSTEVSGSIALGCLLLSLTVIFKHFTKYQGERIRLCLFAGKRLKHS